MVVLSPFVVTAEEDKGYQATSTLAGTRIRTDLRDVGSAISVVTPQFLKDTGAKNNRDLLVYTTNTEVGGLGGNFTGLTAGASLDPYPLMLAPQSNTRVRGLAAADGTRDFFLSDIPWDSYNVGRVDMQRGPNSILFGNGSPAGIINSATNVAMFKNKASVETRLSSTGGFRTSLDLNRVIVADELALRLDAVSENERYRQKPAFERNKRIFGALRYDPGFLKTPSANTSLRLNYEKGKINANRPRQLPLVDKITPWFSAMGKRTYDPFEVWNYVPGVTGSNDRNSTYADGAPNPNYQPWLGQPSAGAQDGVRAIFSDPNSGSFTTNAGGIKTKYGIRGTVGSAGEPIGSIDGGISGFPYSEWVGVASYSEYARNARLPLSGYGQYKDTYIQDPSVFDFYNRLIDGPNKSEKQNWVSWNASLAQTFLNNRVGFEIVQDHQHYHDRQSTLMSNSMALEIDINRNNFDGTPNPNVGRPYISARPNFNNGGSDNQREGVRMTAFGEFKFTDFMEKGLLSSILGRHVVTGVYANDDYKRERRSWSRWQADADYSRWIGNDKPVNIVAVSYLGGSLAAANGLANAHFSNLGAVQLPTSTTVKVFDSHWNRPTDPSVGGYVDPAAPWTDPSQFNIKGTVSTQAENPANYVGWITRPVTVLSADNGMTDLLMTKADKTRSYTSSKAVVWQGFFWDGVIVGTVGVRQDRNKAWNVAAPKRPDDTSDTNAKAYSLAEKANAIVVGTTHSWSIVGHTPKFIRQKLPGNAGISFFYNQSENFQPLAGRFNILGQPLAPPNGTTKDFGFIISALDDRLTLKVNRYVTKVINNQVYINIWQLQAAETWGEIYAMKAKYVNQPGGFSSDADGVVYPPWAGQTAAQSEAMRVAAVAAWEANRAPKAYDTYWQIDRSQWGSWINASGGAGFTPTGDMKSSGTEFELTAQPLKNWSITANASKTSASQSNLDTALTDWVAQRMAVYNGPAGDIRLWWNGSSETVKTFINRDFMPSYRLWQLMEGTNVAELRPWRFNVVTNYSFTTGMLKSVNVGGAYRWEDSVSIGYPLKKTGQKDLEGTDLYDFDINNPIKGPAEGHLDIWVGYDHKLTEKINWRIQLNVRNLFASKKLIPITAQNAVVDANGKITGGEAAGVRIPDLTSWTLTNTFTF